MPQPIRELIEQAMVDIARYRHPDTVEVSRRLDELLIATKQGGYIGGDELESLSLYNGTLTITTSYSVRNCPRSDTFQLPESVIDADDPLAAAKVWGKERRVAAARAEVDSAQRALNRANDALNKILAENLDA